MFSERIFDILVTLSLYGAALSIVFFTFGSTVEHKVLQNSIKRTFDTIINDNSLITLGRTKAKQQFNEKIALLKVALALSQKNAKKSDEELDVEHKKLMKQGAKTFLYVFIICNTCALIVYFATRKYGAINVLHSIGQCVASLVVVVVLQISFTYFVVGKLSSLDTKKLMYNIIEYGTYDPR